MARWQPDAVGRLQQAAYELLSEQAYDDVTVATIAERAGLTKRTFFRHFADKREVLFAGSELLTERFVAGVAEAPEGVPALQAAAAGLTAGTEFFVDRRPFAMRRQSIIAAHPELQERELIKMARLAASVEGALRERGVDPVEAKLAAEATIAIFRVAFERWVEPAESRSFREVAEETLAGFRAVAAA